MCPLLSPGPSKPAFSLSPAGEAAPGAARPGGREPTLSEPAAAETDDLLLAESLLLRRVGRPVEMSSSAILAVAGEALLGCFTAGTHVAPLS